MKSVSFISKQEKSATLCKYKFSFNANVQNTSFLSWAIK